MDFKTIVRLMADRECGILLDGERGYVVRIDDLKEEFKDLGLGPKTPDYSYGEELIEEQNISMTPYGGIERKDQQPIQAFCREPQMGGMSMM